MATCASGYYIGQLRYRTFPPPQKVLLDAAGLEQRSGNLFRNELQSKYVTLAGLLVSVTAVPL